MDAKEKQKIMDSLTEEQRRGIAKIIKDADIEGGYAYRGDDEGSVWEESASETLDVLARFFEKYDPESALD